MTYANYLKCLPNTRDGYVKHDRKRVRNISIYSKYAPIFHTYLNISDIWHVWNVSIHIYLAQALRFSITFRAHFDFQANKAKTKNKKKISCDVSGDWECFTFRKWIAMEYFFLRFTYILQMFYVFVCYTAFAITVIYVHYMHTDTNAHLYIL